MPLIAIPKRKKKTGKFNEPNVLQPSKKSLSMYLAIIHFFVILNCRCKYIIFKFQNDRKMSFLKECIFSKIHSVKNY